LRTPHNPNRDPTQLENDVKKLAVALVASMFVTTAFAQASASAAATAPAKTGTKAKKHKAHNGKPLTLDKSPLNGGDKLQ
jgi:hypothetical protein